MSDDPNTKRHLPTMPVTWHQGDRSTAPAGVTQAVIHTPDGREAELFGRDRAKICAGCKNFRVGAGQSEMARTDFLRELVHVFGWKVPHLGAPPEHLAICDAKEGLLVAPHSLACELYRAKDRHG